MASQRGELVSSSLWTWAYDQKAFPHMADVSWKECLMQHNWGILLTGNKLQGLLVPLLQKIMTKYFTGF